MPDFYQHHTLVLFAGGVGITPIISIVQQLYERARAAQQVWPFFHAFFQMST
jgi:ferredoxin-NADP reductase